MDKYRHIKVHENKIFKYFKLKIKFKDIFSYVA